MEDYPKTLTEFEARFSTEQDCRDCLFQLRWPSGFACPHCGHKKAWPIGEVLFHCANCDYRVSIIAGTIFQGTHKPLTLWFRAIWWLTGQKGGASALGLKRILGLGSYRTAWAWLHKLRRAMVRPGREKLSEEVEVDETYYGGKKHGKRGRGAAGKALIAVAVEDKGVGMGRIRLKQVPNAAAKSLSPFIQENVELGSTVRTDAWRGYNQLTRLGYKHDVRNQKSSVGENPLPLVHQIASLLKRWLLGTHQGAVSHEQLNYYLDEYTFRFNRRTSQHRGKLFYRLLENAVQIQPTTFDRIAKHTRGKKPGKHKM
jgi:transposase-like protein